MKTKRTYGYVRSAIGETSNIQLQTIRITDYCKANNLKLIDVFIDPAKSGLEPFKNNALDEMLSKCRKKDKIDAIVITSLDRLSRNELDYHLISGFLKRKSIELIVINQPQIDDSSEGQFLETILAATSTFYKRMSVNKRKKNL
ncbi:MAG: hypothetical protein A2868_03960 [Candidatus Levybacteria bacterium RIFCSPHIGHO2_01_FULL_40_15b]|nr:MAG: hypothetical protein A2868_03960 [Candidatus Levybacteria bacterium RIFCSPHIGHO2_01_FULL_40_15b]